MFDTRIPFYAIMILISLIANIVIVIAIYKKFNFSKNEVIGALLYENMGIIIGAKLLTYLQNFKQYGEFDFLSLGLSAFGGIIGALICLIFFCWQFKKKIKDMCSIFMPAVPLMYAIGKIGCFIVGCCHGIIYNGVGNVVYNYSTSAPQHTHLFPVQIIETIFFVLIFIYMISKIKNNKFTLKELGFSFVLCGITKFILDFLRMSHVDQLISLNQIISIIFILIGVLIIVRGKNFSS